jgi:hypothetical protein
MNNEQLNILTNEFGFVFPRHQNTATRCTGAGTIIVNRWTDERFSVTLQARPGRRGQVWKATNFDGVLEHLVRLIP